MNIEKIKSVLENYSKVSNKELSDVMVFLNTSNGRVRKRL